MEMLERNRKLMAIATTADFTNRNVVLLLVGMRSDTRQQLVHRSAFIPRAHRCGKIENCLVTSQEGRKKRDINVYTRKTMRSS